MQNDTQCQTATITINCMHLKHTRAANECYGNDCQATTWYELKHKFHAIEREWRCEQQHELKQQMEMNENKSLRRPLDTLAHTHTRAAPRKYTIEL